MAAQERAYLATGYEYTFDGSAGDNLLEIQWDIAPRFYTVEFLMPELFSRAITFELAGRRVRTLAPEDLFLTLCVHAAKHAGSGCAGCVTSQAWRRPEVWTGALLIGERERWASDEL